MKEKIKNRKGLTDVSTSKVKAAKSWVKVCVWPKEKLFTTPKKKKQQQQKNQVSTCRSCNQGNYGIISQAESGREKFMHF